MRRVPHVAGVSCCTVLGKTPETGRKTRPRLLPVEIPLELGIGLVHQPTITNGRVTDI